LVQKYFVSTKRCILYALGTLGGGMTDFPVFIFLAPFYTEVVGLSAQTISWVFLAAGLYDAFTDPFMGAVSDRTRSRWGRRRVYLLAGAVPLGLSFWWMFSPIPGHELTSFLVSYFCFFTFMTVVYVPHFSMSAEMTPDYDERTRIQGYNRGFWILGLLLGVLLPIALEFIIEEPLLRHTAMGASMGLFMTLCILLSFMGTRENPALWTNQRISWRRGMGALLRNSNYLKLVGSYILYNGASAVSSAFLIYFAIYWLKVDEVDVLVAVPIYLVAAVLSVPAWVALARRLEKRSTYILAFLAAALVHFCMLFVPPDPSGVLYLYAIFLLAGIAYGGLMTTPGAMVADVIDLDEHHTGQRREGLYFGVWEFSRKLGASLSIWAGLQILALSGYVPQVEQQVPGVENTVRLVLALAPCLMYLGGALVVSFYNFNRDETRRVQSQLPHSVSSGS
jgi:glycoside/pentoside/hexuronide:cation symporter, GPH family